MLSTLLERCSRCGGCVNVEGGKCWLVGKDMDIPIMVVFIASLACRRTLLPRAEANVGSEERSLSDLMGRRGSVADAREVDRSIGTQGGNPWYDNLHCWISMCAKDSTVARMEGAEA
jgi:hypothetical protein